MSTGGLSVFPADFFVLAESLPDMVRLGVGRHIRRVSDSFSFFSTFTNGA